MLVFSVFSIFDFNYQYSIVLTIDGPCESAKSSPSANPTQNIKEHIYEEIVIPTNEAPPTGKLGIPGKSFANAVLHSVFNKEQFKKSLEKQYEIEENDDVTIPGEMTADDSPDEMTEISRHPETACRVGSEEIDADKSTPCEAVTDNSSNLTPTKKEALAKEEKKVMFSQSTEEYQKKLEEEKSIVKEDVLLLHQPNVDRRWSNMG